jgi:hypothetical protein
MRKNLITTKIVLIFAFDRSILRVGNGLNITRLFLFSLLHISGGLFLSGKPGTLSKDLSNGDGRRVFFGQLTKTCLS